MGRLSTTARDGTTYWSCNGWSGRGILVMAAGLLFAGTVLLYLSWHIVGPALKHVFGPQEDGFFSWCLWLISQVIAGNVATFLLIGAGLVLLAVFTLSGGLIRTTCCCQDGTLLCTVRFMGTQVSSRTIPLRDLRCFAAYYSSTSIGYKITADLHDQAPSPTIMSDWSIPFLLTPYRLGNDPGEPRRLLVLSTLSRELEADQLVLTLNQQLRTS